MIHTLHQTQFIRANPDRVWAYFSTPGNLNELTPPELHFETIGAPGPMYAGQMIAYRIRIAPLVRVRWLTEIRHVETGRYFVDEQRVGPYKLWYHEHHFIPKDDGLEMTDHVTYALGFGPIGDLVRRAWVRPMLERIFRYRRTRVAATFPPS